MKNNMDVVTYSMVRYEYKRHQNLHLRNELFLHNPAYCYLQCNICLVLSISFILNFTRVLQLFVYVIGRDLIVEHIKMYYQ